MSASLTRQESLDLEKCEICLDEYDQDENGNKPYSLFPCGHTFCISCLNSLNEDKCAKCNQPFTNKAPNWALIQVISKQFLKITPDRLNRLSNRLNTLKDEYDEKRKKLTQSNTDSLVEIRNKINERATYLTERIKTVREELLLQCDKYEADNKKYSEQLADYANKLDNFKKILSNPTDNQEELNKIKNNIDKEYYNLKEHLKVMNINIEKQIYNLNISDQKTLDENLYGILYEYKRPSLLRNNQSDNSDSNSGSKVFVLYNDKIGGYLDQNKWGYIRHLEEDPEKFTNAFLRWIFIERNGSFLIENPKTRHRLCAGSRLHIMESDDAYSDKEYTFWEIIYYRAQEKDFVIFRSKKSGEYFSTEKNKLYKPGYLNDDGFHMADVDQDKVLNDPYIKWELIEVPLDSIKQADSVPDNQENEEANPEADD